MSEMVKESDSDSVKTDYVLFKKVHHEFSRPNSEKSQADGKKSSSEFSQHSPTCFHNLKNYCLEYCELSGIHGIQYLGERGRFMVEKLTWFIILTSVCTICLYLISKTYHKWVMYPVIVSFATAEVPTWKIPFPAVTICPEVKSAPEIFNYTNVLLKKALEFDLTAEEERYFETFKLVCDNDLLHSVVNTSDEELVVDRFKLLNDLSSANPDFDPYDVLAIYWLGKVENWKNVLSQTITGSGLCYSFNMLHQDEIFRTISKNNSHALLNDCENRKWSLEAGYSNDEIDSFPRRTFLSGIDGGLIVEGLFANNSHIDYTCSSFLLGFKVFLHHPSEMPNMDKYIRVPLDQAVLIAVLPTMTTVSEELRPYSSEDRKCYFSNERSLLLFSSYTQQNCLDECYFNYTLLECGCVPFYVPYGEDTPTCGPGTEQCLKTSKLMHLLKERDSCNCLPSCTALEYNVEVTQTDWNWREIFEIFLRFGYKNISIDYQNSHLSKLAVYYKQLQFLPSVRHELYASVDFFSKVGGLLGLFIGFSVLSFIEIVYFLSLRIGCNVNKFGRQFWSGEPTKKKL